VPEFFQEQVVGDDLGRAAWQWFAAPERVSALQKEFMDIHRRLRKGGAALAARYIATLIESHAAKRDPVAGDGPPETGG